MSRNSLPHPSRLLAQIDTFLQVFQKSNAKFALLGQVVGEKEFVFSKAHKQATPKTLFILDSSYNPPSRAHYALAYSAVTSAAAGKHPKPHGLLLLFSTANADKAPKPASFEHRLAMMIALTLDIRHALRDKGHDDVDISVGVTTEPYYVGKSQAITADVTTFPERPKHVHIIGYDTVTRFLAPKYYKEYDPPLSALEPYFDEGHSLLVALRPESSSENMKDAGSQAIAEQKAYVESLSQGALNDVGFKQNWAEHIHIMEGEGLEPAVGVSSTAIRNAVEADDRASLEKLCTPHVAAWIQDQKPYVEEDKAKV